MTLLNKLTLVTPTYESLYVLRFMKFQGSRQVSPVILGSLEAFLSIARYLSQFLVMLDIAFNARGDWSPLR